MESTARHARLTPTPHLQELHPLLVGLWTKLCRRPAGLAALCLLTFLPALLPAMPGAANAKSSTKQVALLSAR